MAFLGYPSTYANFGTAENGNPLPNGQMALVLIPHGLTVQEAISPRCQVMLLGNTSSIPSPFTPMQIMTVPPHPHPHQPRETVKVKCKSEFETPAVDLPRSSRSRSPSTPRSVRASLTPTLPAPESESESEFEFFESSAVYEPSSPGRGSQDHHHLEPPIHSEEEEEPKTLKNAHSEILAITPGPGSPSLLEINTTFNSATKAKADPDPDVDVYSPVSSLSSPSPTVNYKEGKSPGILCIMKPKSSSSSSKSMSTSNRNDLWIKPRTPQRVRSSASANVLEISHSRNAAGTGTGKGKGRRYRQVTIDSLRRKMTAEKEKENTVDVSKLKEFRGGCRSQPEPEPENKNLTVTKTSTSKSSKRKSDELELEQMGMDAFDCDNDITDFQRDPDPDETYFQPCVSPHLLNSPKRASTSRPPANSNIQILEPKSPILKQSTRQKQQEAEANYKTPTKSKPELHERHEDLNYTAELFRDFDKIPERPEVDPYGKLSRKKEDRAKLTGIVCDMCRGYFSTMGKDMHPDELQRLQNKTCKHRTARKVQPVMDPLELVSSPSWSTNMPGSEAIVIGVASPPARRKRHDLLD